MPWGTGLAGIHIEPGRGVGFGGQAAGRLVGGLPPHWTSLCRADSANCWQLWSSQADADVIGLGGDWTMVLSKFPR